MVAVDALDQKRLSRVARRELEPPRRGSVATAKRTPIACRNR